MYGKEGMVLCVILLNIREIRTAGVCVLYYMVSLWKAGPGSVHRLAPFHEQGTWCRVVRVSIC